MKRNFLTEMAWRRMISGNTNGIDQMFEESNNPLVAYIGFDPTAKDLHIGNLAAIHMLRHFQLCGHKPLVIVGGGTGFIGDPSGKSNERKFLDKDQIEENVRSIKGEFQRFLDFNCGDSSAELLNNLDWLDNIQLINFLREFGKEISVNEMMKRDSVKDRLNQTGISFTEFSYQVLQAYDFLWLKKNKNCSIQMGGSDQWGNIVAGVDLIRRKLNQDAHGVTLPLIEKAGGGKFGKTEQGNIWLNRNLTSPFAFYQFWMNVEDEDIPKLLRVFTFFDKERIEELDKLAMSSPNTVKEILAEVMMKYVHTSSDLEKVQRVSRILYGKNTMGELASIDQKDLIDSSEGMIKLNLTKASYEAFTNTVDLIATAFNLSKSEIRKLIKNNGIYINKSKVSDDLANAAPKYNLIQEKFLLLQKGKTYCLVTIK